MVALAKLLPRMSVGDFLAWEAGDGQRYELVDGEPRAMAPATTIHGFLQSELGSLIRNHLRDSHSQCEIVANPGVVPHVLAAHNVRIPDLGVTCAPLTPGQATLPDPILLIEFLSPGNAAKTWSNVWAYISLPSLQEILVLDSTRVAAQLLRRTGDGGWPRDAEPVLDGIMRLASIDFTLSLAQLYRRTGLN